MSNTINKYGFFAYGSDYSHSGEFIEEAIKQINKSGNYILIESWKPLRIAGKLIISEILNKIESADFLCADLTGLNDNVLFEIGFAIGRKKPVFLIHDTSITSSVTRYNELNLLSTIGYSNYTNTDDIVNGILHHKPHEDNSDIIASIFKTAELLTTDKILFYLKSQHTTNYNQFIVNKIEDYGFTYLVDDPEEIKVRSLSWYLSHLLSIPSVLIEFSSTKRSGFELHNSKCALVAGIAYGLDIKTQMIVEEYYETPIDYRELLKKFHNKDTCKVAIEPFFSSLLTTLPKLFANKKVEPKPNRQLTTIQKLQFGEVIAEHESDYLYDYYISTAHDQNLIKTEHNIVVGRKGSGKTATLYYLAQKLARNVHNDVCVIKPINFELDGIISLLSTLDDDFQKGYIIESIWKFLIYSEIARTIYLKIKDKPEYALSTIDNDIITFVGENKEIILTDFSTRIEQELESLHGAQGMANQSEFRLKISNILHDNIIKELKELIVKYYGKKQKLVVLIDNLDKSWRKHSSIDLIGKFILGLLGVIGRISKELKGKGQNIHQFDFHLIIFLRSDIFRYLMRIAREPDKIEYTKLVWDDPEVFFRIINERISVLNEDESITPTYFWRELIVSDYGALPIRDFLIQNIIPRPRDIIYFFTTIKNIAVSRGHTKIEEVDIQKGFKEYSNWLFTSVIVENGITLNQMHNFMYNLMGENVILTKEKIINLMQLSDISTDSNENIEYFIDRLISLTIIGCETKPNHFEFLYDFEVEEKNKTLARKLGTDRYRIHNAFVPYLEIVV